MAKVFWWVGTFPATAFFERALFGASWEKSLALAWVATMVTGLGFLLEMARDGLREMRSGGQESQPSESD